MKSVLGMNEAERRASRVTCRANIIVPNVCAFLKCNLQSFLGEYIQNTKFSFILKWNPFPHAYFVPKIET